MVKVNLEIVRLSSMRVACSIGIGDDARCSSVESLLHWAVSAHAVQTSSIRVYGVVKSVGSDGRPVLYEAWLPVSDSINIGIDSPVDALEVPGGFYATSPFTVCHLDLLDWCRNSASHFDPSRPSMEEFVFEAATCALGLGLEAATQVSYLAPIVRDFSELMQRSWLVSAV